MSTSIIYVGLDVHKESVTIAVLPAEAPAPTQVDRLPHEHRKLRAYLARLAQQGELRCCYEASGAGYVLQRQLTQWGYPCDIVAPSLIPQRPGHQRKHDRYDARQLARLYRAGELTVIRIPTEAEERVRDLVRCRATFQRDLLRTRQRVLKFLRRRGLVYARGKSHWTQTHRHWLAALLASPTSAGLGPEDATVLSEHLALLGYLEQRRAELDRQIAALALTPALQGTVGRLSSFRGLDTHAAVVLATELGDWQRFTTAGQLMAYVGLVPREDSSGPRERRGSITKAGNAYCRHVLVQAAWAYRHPPAVGAALRARQRGQAAGVVAHSWQAQQRLHRLYRRIAARRGAAVAVVAVARELVGFLWAVAQAPAADRPAQAA
jgi:transposase